MKTTDIIRIALIASGKMQKDLADAYGMSKQTFSNKMKRNAWYVRDLCNQVKDVTGIDVIIRLPDGTEYVVTDDPEAEINPYMQRKADKEEKEITELLDSTEEFDLI